MMAAMLAWFAALVPVIMALDYMRVEMQRLAAPPDPDAPVTDGRYR